MAVQSDAAIPWDAVYGEKGREHVSWYQATPAMSLQLFEALGIARDAAIIDVGGGASSLAPSLHERGYADLTVLDVSRAALELARASLPASATVVTIEADVRSWSPLRAYDVWHDRATFHFLTADGERSGYLHALRAALRPGGVVIIGTFAEDGPTHCSNLPVSRYSAEQLQAALSDGFAPLMSRREVHHTPWGTAQPFTWVVARRTTTSTTAPAAASSSTAPSTPVGRSSA